MTTTNALPTADRIALAAAVSAAAPGVVLSAVDVHDFGAKGDAVGTGDGTITGGNTLTSAQYTFTTANVGQKLYLQQDTTERAITGVSGGAAVFTPSASNVTPCYWLCGTDDTAAFDAAFVYAANSLSGRVGSALGTQAFAYVRGPIPLGGAVQMRAGHGYLVGNTQTSFNAGRLSSIVVPRRCSLRGAAGGFYGSTIHLKPNSYGHVIANEGNGAAAFSDFTTLSNFTVYAYGSDWSPNSLDGINITVADNGYSKIDPFNRVMSVQVYNAGRDGFSFTGRGELFGFDLIASYCRRRGVFIDRLSDARFLHMVAGGNDQTGIYVNGGGPIHIGHSKAFYNGASGGTDHKNSANIVLTSDNEYTGLTSLFDCEAQESRGSSLVIESGRNIVSAFQAYDPGRAGLTAGSLPDVIAGIHLRGGFCNNNVINGVVRPTLTNFGAAGANWGSAGDAVHIDLFDAALGGPQLTGGDVYTTRATTVPAYRGIEYTTGSAKGGAGTSNGKNTGFRVDGVACT